MPIHLSGMKRSTGIIVLALGCALTCAALVDPGQRIWHCVNPKDVGGIVRDRVPGRILLPDRHERAEAVFSPPARSRPSK